MRYAVGERVKSVKGKNHLQETFIQYPEPLLFIHFFLLLWTKMFEGLYEEYTLQFSLMNQGSYVKNQKIYLGSLENTKKK